ncbi:MAG TPA: AraC family transcriptional regulator [Bacillota bacterium]|nr:AraC family transcriptional regulator [Bacillota bacterium]
MKCNYCADIERQRSRSLYHTPSIIAKRLSFYLESWGHYFAGPDYFLEREELENFQLIYAAAGSGILKYRGKEYQISPHRAVVINCMEYQFYQTSPEGFWETKWIHFNGLVAAEYERMINEDALTVCAFIEPSKIERYLDEIGASSEKGDYYFDVKVAMLITNILTEMVTNKINIENNKHNAVMDQVITFIQNNYQQKINTDDFIKIAHLSKFYFLKLFKRYTGVSPYEYLTQYRVNVSKSLLKETGLSVNEIAEKVGFNNINNYIREFKKLVGTTPLKYRNYWIT